MAQQVHANLDDLRRLSRDIERAQSDVAEAVKRLEASLRAADWQDAARRDFEAKLKQAVAVSRTFMQRLDDLKPILRKKTGELAQYLR